MTRMFAFVFGVIAYAGFMAWMVYMIGFLGHFPVPKSINSPPVDPVWMSLLINFLIIFIFGFQHAVMARPKFKQWITQFIPQALERSLFVFTADVIMWVMIWQWRPIEGVVWQIENTVIAYTLTGIAILGWLGACLSSFMINHFELLGLQQVWHYLRGTEPKRITFKLRGFYKYVRHPLMTGFLVFFWVTPNMTWSHLYFAFLFTCYVLIGTKFEERDLIKHHPEEYPEYMKKVPGLIPFTKR